MSLVGIHIIRDAFTPAQRRALIEKVTDAMIAAEGENMRVSRVPSFADLLLAFPGEPGDILERSRKPARALRDAGL
jgi:hypothetical protein